MKNLLAVLGVSFLLAACFDDSKKQDIDSGQMPIEQKQPQTDVNAEEKPSEQRREEARPSLEKIDQSKKTADVDKKNIQSITPPQKEENVLVKKNKPVSQQKVVGKQRKLEKSTSKKSFTTASREMKLESNSKGLSAKSVPIRHTRDVSGTYENGKQISNFSPEELRVGAQVPMSDNEIRQEKIQCRYPFMSPQEIAENNCGIKNVTISY